MLRMGKLADYGAVIMAHMACRPEQVLSAQEVALAVGLELPTVSKLLKMLARAELLRSQRGSRGGYALVRTPEGISVAEIIDSIEGYPMGLTECSSEPGLCRRESYCAVRDNWQQVSRVVRATLERMTLAELARPLPPVVSISHEAAKVGGVASMRKSSMQKLSGGAR